MSVYKEKSGKWHVIYRYTDWTGERKQSSKRGFGTKREAQHWEAEQKMQVTANLDMSFVPNVIFDIVIYNRQSPIVLSIKTSLRERWKQADLEAVALKYVYRNSEAYLLNNSPSENEVRKKDENGYMGLDAFIYVGDDEFDSLVEKIKDSDIQSFEQIPVFSSYKEYDDTSILL